MGVERVAVLGGGPMGPGIAESEEGFATAEDIAVREAARA